MYNTNFQQTTNNEWKTTKIYIHYIPTYPFLGIDSNEASI